MKEITTVESEPKLKAQISILVRKALNFMNREDFPEDLIEPFAEHLALKIIEQGEIADGKIKSVKEGGTQYDYDTSRGNSVVEEAFLSLKTQLFCFRKVGTL